MDVWVRTIEQKLRIMLSKKIHKALNEQVAMESNASSKYLAMASWCDTQGLEGCAAFLYRQSDEERMHMLKLVHYINEMDGHAVVPGISAPKLEYPSVQELFNMVYEHEKAVSASIYKIYDLASKEKDYSTITFLQWYVEEQREEEAMMRTILDKLRLIGDGPQALYYIDMEISKFNAAVEKEEAAA